MSPPILVFDLDGTISDPSVGFVHSLNYSLEHFGYPKIAAPDAAKYIGPPIEHSFQVITGQSSKEHLIELVSKYREHYGEVGIAENALYPGISEALESLRAMNIPMGLCTSKKVDFADRILQMFGLRQHFEFLSGGDIGISKAQQLSTLIADGRISDSAVMIGDRAVDIESAKANQMRSIGVLWGHGSKQELLAANPTRLVFTPPELIGIHEVLGQP